ncbi:MAG: hypothetical protein ACRCVT_02620 [Leadbetterella sp.]
MKKSIFLFLILSIRILGQNVTINPNGITPVQSETLYPRLPYSQILTLSNPIKGDLAYDLTFNCLRLYNGSKWLNLLTGLDTNQPATLAWSISSMGSTGISKIQKDASGNIFALGSFKETTNFGSITITSNGDNDIFLAKYDEVGNLIWVKTAGSPAGDVGIDLKIDNFGNALIIGYYYDNISFSGTILTYTGVSDVCIAKYDNNGVFLWAKKAAGSGFDIPSSVETDVDGNVYISGHFLSSITFFGLSNLILNSAGGKDGFLAKYDANGNILWAKSISSIDENIVGDMEISGTNLYLIGNYSGTVNLGNSISISSSTTSNDVFIGRFDLNGNCLNAINLGSAVLTVNRITKDNNSNFYICGTVNGSTTIGGTQVILNSGTSSFFAKLNSSLNINYVRPIPCQSLSKAKELEIDTAGNIYVVGDFSGTISNYNQSLVSKGEHDIYLAKYNPAGDPLLFQNFGSTTYESGNSLCIGSNVYIAGFFIGRTNLGNGLNVPGPWTNGYILRVSE